MAVDYSEYKIDLDELACKRLLSQFKKSDKGIIPLVSATVEQTQDWNDIILSVLEGRSLDQASGVQLDIIGEIVGLERPTVDAGDVFYVTADSNILKPDSLFTAYTTNAPTSGNFIPMDDIAYIAFLKGKIFKNQISACSVPEIIQYLKITLDVDGSVVNCSDELACISIVVPNTIPEPYIAILISKESDNKVENEYFIPVPQGVRLRSVILSPPVTFRFDNSTGSELYGGFDRGAFSLGVQVE